VEEVVRAPGTDLHTPALCDVEVASGLRRAIARRAPSAQRAMLALEDYRDLPLTRHGHLALLPRVLQLRANLSAYDATYVALGEQLGAALLTADARLRSAARARLSVLP